MNNFKTFLESNTTNKFNIHWQIVRTKARSIKNVDDKISYVLGFLNKHPNIHNYNRVLNWVKMTGIAYPDNSEQQQAFNDTLIQLQNDKDNFISKDDDDNDLSIISTDDLKLVLNDLKKRKYGFQYKTVPKAHIEFVDKLEQEINNR